MQRDKSGLLAGTKRISLSEAPVSQCAFAFEDEDFRGYASFRVLDLERGQDNFDCDMCRFAYQVWLAIQASPALMHRLLEQRDEVRNYAQALRSLLGHLTPREDTGPDFQLRFTKGGAGSVESHRMEGHLEFVIVKCASSDVSSIPDEPPIQAPKKLCERIMEELEDCRQTHSQCANPLRMTDPHFSPKRVLEVNEAGIVRVVEGSKACRWAALSYCWGDNSGAVTLTRYNYDQYQAGVPLSTMPRLFQEAFTVCQWLEVEYLWIDALCILQDNRQDWQEQAGEMAKIYANSTVTIAAEDAVGPSRPLLREAYFCSPRAPINHFDGVYIQATEDRAEHDSRLHMNCILGSRAWTYQEVELSPRLICFRDEAIIWECSEHRSNSLQMAEQARYEYVSSAAAQSCYLTHKQLESYDQSMNMTANGRELCIGGSEPVGMTWRDLVFNYSKRKLTFQADRLPALAALAEEFGRRSTSAGDYLFGLWSGTLCQDLCWRLNTSNLHPTPVHRNTAIGMPSWSWASITTPVWWEESRPSKGQYGSPLSCVKLIGTDIQLDGSPYLGIGTKAAITIEAPFLRLRVKERLKRTQEDWPRDLLRNVDGPLIDNAMFSGSWDDFTAPIQFIPDCLDDELREEDERAESNFRLVLLILQERRYFELGCIVLRSDGESSSYRRVGFGEVGLAVRNIASAWYRGQFYKISEKPEIIQYQSPDKTWHKQAKLHGSNEDPRLTSFVVKSTRLGNEARYADAVPREETPRDNEGFADEYEDGANDDDDEDDADCEDKDDDDEDEGEYGDALSRKVFNLAMEDLPVGKFTIE